MKLYQLSNFTKGWVVGNFEPSLHVTPAMEVAVKTYQAGDYEPRHYHKIATEITIIVSGQVEMNGVSYQTNDIIVIEPNESTDFLCLTDVITTVIKTQSVANDKYLGSP